MAASATVPRRRPHGEQVVVGVRFGNDPVDSVAPKEWEAVYKAVAAALAAG